MAGDATSEVQSPKRFAPRTGMRIASFISGAPYGISFSVEQDEVVGIMGTNGAGKSAIVEQPGPRSWSRRAPDRRCGIKPLFDQNL
jgi:hypothetical protein